MSEVSGEGGKQAPVQIAGGSDRLLELYKLAVEMADRVSARRAAANAFFLTLNTALLAVVGLVRPAESGDVKGPVAGDRFGLVVLSLAGVAVALTWWTLLRSYRELNRAKFLVVNELELQLPAAPFTEEWKHLVVERSPKLRGRYVELGQAERVVPLVYAAIYIAAAVHALRFVG